MALWQRKRRLGRTDLDVTALALGGVGMAQAPSDDAAAQLVHRAVARGINYIDTSPLYGESERRLGLALQGLDRASLILSTKVGTHPSRHKQSRDAVLWSVENSLKLLQTDYIDLLLVHDPDDMAPVMAPGGAFDALDELEQQKVIGWRGLGVRSLEFHVQAIEADRVDAVLTYSDYLPIRTTAEERLLPLAAERHIGIINGSPMDHGLLTGQDPELIPQEQIRYAPPADVAGCRKLHAFSQQHGIPMAALVLQFPLRESRIHTTLTGAKSPEELDANIAACEYPVPDGAWLAMAAVLQ